MSKIAPVLAQWMQLLLTQGLWRVIVQHKFRQPRAAQSESWDIMTKAAHVNHSIFQRPTRKPNCWKKLLVRAYSIPSTATTRPSTWRKNDTAASNASAKVTMFQQMEETETKKENCQVSRNFNRKNIIVQFALVDIQQPLPFLERSMQLCRLTQWLWPALDGLWSSCLQAAQQRSWILKKQQNAQIETPNKKLWKKLVTCP